MFVYKVDVELLLKVVELKDAEKIFKLTDKSRSYLREWLPWLDTTTTVEDTKQFIEFCIKGYEENKSLTMVILFNKEIVGVAGFNSIDRTNKIVHIGYWLGEDYQGKGIMTRVVKGLTNYAFEQLQLNRVEIRAAIGNIKSRSIPERLGFVEEGIIRDAEWLYDHYVDHVVYGMLAREWTKIVSRKDESD